MVKQWKAIMKVDRSRGYNERLNGGVVKVNFFIV